jgi:hypothetical protein
MGATLRPVDQPACRRVVRGHVLHDAAADALAQFVAQVAVTTTHLFVPIAETAREIWMLEGVDR